MKNIGKHIERMMIPYREIEKMTQPIKEIQKQLFASTLAMQKAIEPVKTMQKSLEEPLLNFQRNWGKTERIYRENP